MLRVCKGSVLHQGRIYQPGEILPQLGQEDEATLIALGNCTREEVPFPGRKPARSTPKREPGQDGEDGPRTGVD